ncbi:hypothetical protein RJ639_023341 [Escallonia herrerae]|uniref:SCP domain-containing protein n=1 Tax=Escallonia herrerae TaxID=1293975 RepID=A0AA88V0V7_9ASTE|nr:hypothetical protein RJ639_023341 [Escallonia herrerae]
MGWCNMSVAFLGVLGLIMVHSTQAQNSRQDYLDAHNAARAKVGVGPLTWDDGVARYAQNYANQRIGDCALKHSQGGPYGENLAKGSGDFTGKAAVDLWVGEKQYYDYNSNSCASGKVCGHYTQNYLALNFETCNDAEQHCDGYLSQSGLNFHQSTV